jgi:hypothetical protein
MYTAGEAIVWAAVLGPACAAQAALVVKPSTLPGGVRSAICRIADFPRPHSSSTAFGHQILDAPLVQRLSQLAQAQKGKGQEARGRCARGYSSHGRGPRGRGGRRTPGQGARYKPLRGGRDAMGALAGDLERTRTTWRCTKRAWPGA